MARGEPRSKSAVRLWLMDTGCGNDLVDRREIHALRRLIRRSNFPCTFKTANGLTKAEHEAVIVVPEIDDTFFTVRS